MLGEVLDETRETPRAGRPDGGSEPGSGWAGSGQDPPAPARPTGGGAARPPGGAAAQAGSAPLTHQDEAGRARMVDVSQKPSTLRTARAAATVRLGAELRARLLAGTLPKGEALAVARIAGIQAAKDTARLVPLCHPVALSQIAVDFEPSGDGALRVTAEARTVGPTGVEMEALCAAAVAALTIYDMVKAQGRGVSIERVELLHKSGGRSGTWDRPAEDRPAADRAPQDRPTEDRADGPAEPPR